MPPKTESLICALCGLLKPPDANTLRNRHQQTRKCLERAFEMQRSAPETRANMIFDRCAMCQLQKTEATFATDGVDALDSDWRVKSLGVASIGPLLCRMNSTNFTLLTVVSRSPHLGEHVWCETGCPTDESSDFVEACYGYVCSCLGLCWLASK